MTDVHSLAGAYALDAVDDLERAALRRHLAECEGCSLEVAELTEAAARLTDDTWSDPPPELRDAVLAQVSRTTQVKPGATPRSRAERAAGRAAGPVRWRRWAAAAVAAGLLAGGAGAATYLLQEQRVQEERDRVAQAQAQAAEIEAVLTAPDASVSQQPAAESGTVTVIGSRQRDGAVVVLAALPEPDADQAYQLWRRTGGELVSAGVLAAGVGSTTALVTGLGTADLIGVSLEPAAGSPTGQPTEGQIVATVPVT